MRLPTLALALAAFAGSAAAATPPALLIRDVTIVDTIAGRNVAHQDVHVADGRITAITPTRPVAEPSPDRRVVDGSGKFLAPGLWDMHAHWWDENYLPLFVLNGVTGIRQMRGYTLHHAWRAKGIAGTRWAPHMLLGSPLIDGKPPIWTPSLEVETADQARAVVALLDEADVDFLKVYDKLSLPAYEALVDEARKRKLPVIGHVPTLVGWQRAMELGVQRDFHHLLELKDSASRDSEELVRRRSLVDSSLDADAGPTPEQRRERTAIFESAMDTFDERQFATLVKQLVAGKVWITPTLVLWDARFRKFDPALQSDPRLKQLPGWIVDYWKEATPPLDEDVRAEIAMSKRRLPFYMARVRAMHEAGVPMLAGSDVVIPYIFPGTGIHDELDLLVQAGLSPLAALQTATRNVGQFLGRNDVGVIRPGASADLVLLAADPLLDISNVRRIEGVGIGGEWIDAKQRADGFARLERVVAAPVVTGAVLDAVKGQGLDAGLAAYDSQCPALDEVRNCDPPGTVAAIDRHLVKAKDAGARAKLMAWADARLIADEQVQEILIDYYKETGNREGEARALERALGLAPGAPWLLKLQQAAAANPMP